jgi:hypothetical protein
MTKTPFKLRSGNAPLKQTVENKKKTVGGEINRFFSDLGSRLQKGTSKVEKFKAKRKKAVADKAAASPDGLTNFQRRQADKKAQRKSGGKSKYQRSVEARKTRKKLKPGEFTTKQKLEGKLVPNQKIMNKKVEVKNQTEKVIPPKKEVKNNTSKLTYRQAYRKHRDAGDKTFMHNGNKYTTESRSEKAARLNR